MASLPITRENLLALVPGDQIIDDRGLPWTVVRNKGARGEKIVLFLRFMEESHDPEEDEYWVQQAEQGEGFDFIQACEYARDVDLSSPDTRIEKAA